MRHLLGCTLLLLLLSPLSSVASRKNWAFQESEIPLHPVTRVTTPLGNIDGIACDSFPDVIKYLGIPFANPAVGNLRFRPPVPYNLSYPSPALQATTNPPPCGSYCAKIGDFIGTDYSSEDCLFLNIWVPPEASVPGAKVPVRVYIHGGHDLECCASDPFLDGCTYVAKTGAIQVNMQYRKGPFGLLAHPATWEESNMTGNWAILDQQLALEWVRDNIAFFGGDPSQVLLNGHSQGGQYVDLHVVAPKSWGLFQSAISQSPPCVRQLTLTEAYALTNEFVALVGCNSSKSIPSDEIQCLRNLSWSTLFLAANEMLENVGLDYAMCESVNWKPTFQVIADGVVLPDHVANSLRKGNYAPVPYLVGFATNEGNFFVEDLDVNEDTFSNILGDIYPGADTGPIQEMYPIYQYSVLSSPLRAQLGDLWTDVFFKCPILERLDSRSSGGLAAPSYLYQWDVTPTCPADWQYLGAYHSVDLMFTLGIVTNINPPDGTCNFTAKEVIVSDHTLTAWTTMATDKIPKWKNGSYWAEWNTDTQLGTFLNVDNTGTKVIDLKTRCLTLQEAKMVALNVQKNISGVSTD